MSSFEVTDEGSTKTMHLEAKFKYNGELFGIFIDECPGEEQCTCGEFEHICILMGLTPELDPYDIPEGMQDILAEFIEDNQTALAEGRMTQEAYDLIFETVER